MCGEKRLPPVEAAHLLPQTLSCQGLLDSFSLARLEIVGMLFDIFDNVFLLNLALEATQRALQGFTVIENYFRQSEHLLFDDPVKYRAAGMLSSSNDCGAPGGARILRALSIVKPSARWKRATTGTPQSKLVALVAMPNWNGGSIQTIAFFGQSRYFPGDSLL